jgi:hypothetical protein
MMLSSASGEMARNNRPPGAICIHNGAICLALSRLNGLTLKYVRRQSIFGSSATCSIALAAVQSE